MSTFQIDKSLGSKIFAFNVAILRPEYPIRKMILSSKDELEALYVIKPQSGYDDYFKETEKVLNNHYVVLKSLGFESNKDQDGNDAEITYKELYSIAASMGEIEMVRKINNQETLSLKKYSEIRYLAALNDSNDIVFYKE